MPGSYFTPSQTGKRESRGDGPEVYPFRVSPRLQHSRHTRLMTRGWSISVRSLSTATLMELYRLLKESDDKRQTAEIQRELVSRARAEGLTTQEIVDALVASVGKRRERAAIASEWCEALGLTEMEAKRLAG